MSSLNGNRTEISNYIENVLDSALSDDASTIKQSYIVLEVIKRPFGFLFIPRYPTSLILNSELYYKIYDIVSAAVFPDYTCIRPTSMQIVKVEHQTLETARGFYFPWHVGQNKRFVGSVASILDRYDLNSCIPIMEGMTVNRRATTWIISGNIGSGKSYTLRYLEEAFQNTMNASRTKKAKLIVIDPKKSDGARYAKRHPEIDLLVPNSNDRPEDFLTKVNAKLASVMNTLNLRQEQLYQESHRISTNANEIDAYPIWVIVEEMASLTLGLSASSRQVKDLHRELEEIALLGREALIGLVIVTQIARNDIIPIPIRSQMNVRILLGRIDKESVQYLFPSMTDGLSIPIGGVGTGIIEINDGEHYGIEPVSMPTIIEDKKEDINNESNG